MSNSNSIDMKTSYDNSSGMISVIIPVYNVEPYLRKCIHSVQNNTYKQLEIICINDGSPDGCGMILDEFAKNDSRIKVIHQENQGVAAARNVGLKTATGEYVAFVDSDDFIHPRYFETLYNCMSEKKADIVVCGCQKFAEDEDVAPAEYQHLSYSRIGCDEFFNHYYARHMIWARLYRRRDLQDIWFTPDVRMADDTLFNLRVVASIKKPIVYETETPLYYYLIRSTSIVHTGKAERMMDTGNWYMAHRGDFLEECRGEWSWLLMIQVIKATLSYRHTVRYIRRNDDQVKHADIILKTVFKDLKRVKKLSLKDHIIYGVMISSASLYRLFRIIEDPTMLKWEKMEKQ